jgi:hypothetical protein
MDAAARERYEAWEGSQKVRPLSVESWRKKVRGGGDGGLYTRAKMRRLGSSGQYDSSIARAYCCRLYDDSLNS